MAVGRRSEETCRRCGAPTAVDGALMQHLDSDPLQVFECVRCGAILDIGGHRW
ncbi:hypothetical protein [Halogeometricum luteum]|uniref:Small CPxCG-related zinc finger protein n=1 Tax=Halogeometricum luteum TaxID=2950537 RepID=A0ABU2FZJ4_9EURY|nr:hypothetical protein [Halogeometricum sp. S3BR5-2]MDS0293479.1 hypothetical protein [Halogeometricum sp. S3BR5-2]